MAAQQFAVLGWHFTDAGADQVEGAPYAFGWGLSPDTYRISVPEAQGYLKYTFPGNNPIAFTVIKGDDGKDSGVKASVSVGRLYAEPYASTGWLTWYDDKRSLGDLLFGLATPAAALPASGSKRYRFDDAAQPWDLIIDFSARKVSGKVAVAWTDAWGPYEPGFYDVIDGQFEPATGKITGNFSVNGTALPGEIHGRLMGPKAGELALAVMGPAFNPYDKVFQQTWFTRPGLECPAC
jgi:hypothetical protein